MRFEVGNIITNIREDTWDNSVLIDEILNDVYWVGFPRVVVDIGTHIGGTSLLCASRGAVVYAYEPSKENYKQLLKNIKLNEFGYLIKPKRLGVGKAGKRKLYHHQSNYGCFSLNRKNTTGMTNDGEEINVISVNKVFKDIPYCDFCKIDCEGAEVEFYRDLPVDKIGRLSIELHGIKEEEITEFLKQYYVVKRIENVLICR